MHENWKVSSILQGVSYAKLLEKLCNSMKILINIMYRIAQPDNKFIMKDYIEFERQIGICKKFYVSDHNNLII